MPWRCCNNPVKAVDQFRCFRLDTIQFALLSVSVSVVGTHKWLQWLWTKHVTYLLLTFQLTDWELQRRGDLHIVVLEIRRTLHKAWDCRWNYGPSYGRTGARCNVVVMLLCYKPEGSGFETRGGEWMFSIYLILLAALGPGVYSASNRN
jgi:hypothetical protein